MPKGLKSTSAPITISFAVTETAPAVFTDAVVALQLNVLDREVFVVTGCNLDVSAPDAIAATNTSVSGCLSSTARTTMGFLNDSNVLSTANDSIRAAGFVDGGVGFSSQYGEAPATGMDYLGIIATNDFHIMVQGTANVGAKSLSGKLYGYRAIADAATFAALTQSELLSA